ncbi:MAG: penicillin-binding protein, partial [Pseudomonadota bacterium]|nr:penicillin-binding protein [Pseudomonadota bacterium]
GGGLSLPVWINFMEYALKGVPVTEFTPPEGVVNIGGEWFYDEYAKGSGISSVGLGDKPAPGAGANNPVQGQPVPPGAVIESPPPGDERKRILDLFKN